ncbi:MAG: phosphoribosyltransferase [Candidatus Rokubacteria bacterium]|nr:phosphoribosyltransferase [Candidatus Rokubacteria bacterium]
MQFKDRKHAGQVLAQRLEHYRDQPDVVILALPRGGVPVAFEVAQALHAPLDVFIVRKLGFPGHEEFAMGAIATGGVRVMNPDAMGLEVPQAAVEEVTARERTELERRERLYRGDRPPAVIEGRIVILVDDGLATGATMRAASTAVKQQQPKRVVVAVPVVAPDTCDAFRTEVDEVICVVTPEPFRAVALWYEAFDQTTDEEVHALLEAARQAEAPSAR